MQQKKIKISNKLGLHARATAKLVAVANRYHSSIEVFCADKKANGKSIMAVMMLAADKGSEIQFNIDGHDEYECLQAIEQLISNKFDEE